MDRPFNAKVSCTDGPGGRSARVILQPTTKTITHLVVSTELFPKTDYLVSVDHVLESTPDEIRLNCSREELGTMPIFSQMHFVPSELAGFIGGLFLMWPYYAPEGSAILLEEENIPAKELAIRRGAKVDAADGESGRVDEFLINRSNDRITHLLMCEGHFWGHEDIAIPVGQIDHFTDTTVYLRLHKQDVEKLPSIPVRHSWTK